MALEDFEKELAASKTLEESSSKSKKRHRSRSESPHRERHKHRSHRSERGHNSNNGRHDGEERRHGHGHRRKRSCHDDDGHRRREEPSARERLEAPQSPSAKKDLAESEGDEWVERDVTPPIQEETLDKNISEGTIKAPAARDSWMEAPSALDVDYVQRKRKVSPPAQHVAAAEADYKLKIHERELNHHLKDLQNERGDVEQEKSSAAKAALEQPAQHKVTYTFGDAGSSWRMAKLKNAYRQAQETGRKVEDVAVERFGDLRAFDDAREEEADLERRKMYGKGYVGKEKPSGELFQERKLDSGVRREHPPEEEESDDEFEGVQGRVMPEQDAPMSTVALDQTALNRLKASMMKAKLRKDPDAARLEAEYNAAMAASSNSRQGGVVVLNKMENRMLAGGRSGEVNTIDNKRGKERGLVTENEDMSIDDMVRQEKRTKYNSEGMAFAERIAKDAKFDNDLDYLDENAQRLSTMAPKSDLNLRNGAISDYHKTQRALENCPLCYHEDRSPPLPPQAPVVSLATRTYLTLPTSPEITPYGLCATIVPIQHRKNMLECDDDEWEEVRNFMKSLTRFYATSKPARRVIFYENAANAGIQRHASIEAVPLPPGLGETAPAFFREAILAADEEWSQHRKIIDTQAKAEAGLGKMAFRKSLVSELPYFHVWFTVDGGMGHVVEDARRWPKGDLFAREVLGGMLDTSKEVAKRQGRWRRGDAEMKERVDKFKKGWEKHDWTSVLLDAQ